jgi:meso-butanediol dehydrogenase/(S,S)-butanediol dehydrogenase/diacetyl reductase
MDRFTGRVAIVTGTASGIGKAVALRLASEGAAVGCLDIAEDALAGTVKEIEAAGGRAVGAPANVSDEGSVKAAVAGVVDALGRPSVLCNVAGIGRFSHTHELALAEWDRIIGVNLTGTFLMCREVLPHLLDGGGNIVNTASNAGLMGQPWSAAYCASKGGVVQLTRALAQEYINQGVRVNAVAPGGTDTPIQQSFGLPDGADGKLLRRIISPMGMATTEEMASLFAYIASDEARMMNGAIVSMDGALTA